MTDSPARHNDLLQWDAIADEPYLALLGYPGLRLTPWRGMQETEALRLFNDPTVTKYSCRRPFPYNREHLEYFTDLTAPYSQETVNTILRRSSSSSAASDLPHPAEMPFFPLMVIRNHATGQLIGDVQLFQPESDYWDMELDRSLRVVVPQIDSPEEQTWAISYNILPEWRNKGLGGAVVDVVVGGWAKWVGLGQVMAYIETDNILSSRLAASRGFTKRRTFMQAWPEGKGGGEREMNEWVVSVARYGQRSAGDGTSLVMSKPSLGSQR